MPVSAHLDLLIRHGTVVSGADSTVADVAVRDGVIVGVGDLSGYSAAREIDADGLLVMPGVIDEHVHPVYVDDPAYISEVALHGGVTTMMHFAYAHPGESLVEQCNLLRQQSEEGHVDFAIHGGMFDPEAQIAEIPAAAAAGIRTFKVFLAYAAQGWMTDDRNFVRALRAIRSVDGLLLVHCENGIAIDVLEQDASEGRLGVDPVEMVTRSRPPVIEAEAVARAISLAEAFSSPLFVVHVTSARALAVVQDAHRRGLPIVAESCPQYLTLTEAAMREHGALAKIGPPLRTPDDVHALWRGIQQGTLQTVGSDHAPKKTVADRDVPLVDAGFGAPSLETMLSVVYDQGVAAGRIPVERLVQLLSEHPARVFGLWPRKGRVGVGADADMILWDPSARRTITAETQHSRAGYSLYEGRRVTGEAKAVIVNGQVAVRDGVQQELTNRGRFLVTGPFDTRVGRAERASVPSPGLNGRVFGEREQVLR